MTKNKLIGAGVLIAATAGLLHFFSSFRIKKTEKIISRPSRYPRPDVVVVKKVIIIEKKKK
jgi:hypothetical protein